jgi:hypothetical protein
MEPAGKGSCDRGFVFVSRPEITLLRWGGSLFVPLRCNSAAGADTAVGDRRARAQGLLLVDLRLPEWRLNKIGGSQLSTMAKDKRILGPMRMQPLERGSTVPKQMRPMMPTAGGAKKAPEPVQEPTRTEAIRVAKARITRRNSLLIQRKALKESRAHH